LYFEIDDLMKTKLKNEKELRELKKQLETKI
jgi:hypothetical protein